MASMTYLALCQYAHRLLRSGNAQPGTQPGAIPLAAGLDQVVYDIVDIVPRAWEWVQNEHPSWNFMRKEGNYTLSSGLRTYALTALQTSIPDYYGFIPFWSTMNTPYFLMYDSGFSPINQRSDYIFPFIEYGEWRGFYDRTPRPTAAQPNRITEWPNKTLELDPTPQNAPSGSPWAIKFDYRTVNQILTASGDIPNLPPEFHELISWVAVRMICETRMDTGPLYQSSNNEIQKYMDRLKARYLPQIQVDMVYA